MMSDKQKPYYIIEGKVYPRVTRILSIIKDIEYEGNPDPILFEEAASIGSKVHKLIEIDINGALKEKEYTGKYTHQVDSCMQAYQDWKKLRNPILPKAEVRAWSTQHQVACTIDLTDDEYITDFKTSHKLLFKHWLQVNANNYIWHEWAQAQEPYRQKCRLVRLDKTLAMYQEEVRPYSDALWQTFLKIKEVYIDILGSELLDGELELLGREHGDDSGTV